MNKRGDFLSVQSLIVLCFPGIAMCMDFIMERVVNEFIIVLFLAGFWWQIRQNGILGGLSGVMGFLFPCILLLPLFYFRMLGAGDIKLFSGLGIFLGIPDVFKLILCSLILGGLLSFAFLISCGNLKERFSYFFNYVYKYSQSKVLYPYMKKGNQPENFHFTVPIFLSVMLYVGGFY